MRVAVDLYVDRQSWLHRADPRTKLAFVASGLLVLLLVKNLYLMLGAVVLLHLLHWSARIPAERVRFVWRTLLPISIMISTLWILFYPTGRPILEFWVIRITPLSMAQGFMLALRIIAMALLIFAWLFTTDNNKIVLSLVRLRIPYQWGLVLALALRYIPTFQSMYTTISEAQQARGLRIGEGAGFKRVRVLMPIFVAMIISAMRASDQLAKALQARGFGVDLGARTYLRDLHFRTLDWVYLTGLILTLGLTLYLRFAYGFGTQTLQVFP